MFAQHGFGLRKGTQATLSPARPRGVPLQLEKYQVRCTDFWGVSVECLSSQLCPRPCRQLLGRHLDKIRLF